MSDSPRIGFVGTGLIGEPMVERLLADGCSTTVYARRPEVRERLGALGAITATTPEQLAAADVVVACLFTDDQVLEVCPPIIEKMRPGSVFLSHTTGSPSTVRRLGALAADVGVSVVEAPFSGNPAAIRRGQLTVMLGGEGTGVDIAAHTVSAYACNIIRTGGLGTALAAKLLNNALFAAFSQITLSALQSAETLGLTEEKLLEVLAACSGGSTAATYITASGQPAVTYSERLPRYLRKDLDTVRTVASELNVEINALLTAAELGPMNLVDDRLSTEQLESSPT
ncbi:UNVERIFIED_CONTAM: 3-hydroxyisobutyrate dehydrogenase-like beta-hydroxyacid dehydrogenase [Williamsia faeni]